MDDTTNVRAAASDRARDSEPALVFALTGGLAGVASQSLDRLIASAPELRFSDLLADAHGETALDWPGDPASLAALRERCLARHDGFAMSPAIEPPPAHLAELRAWAAAARVSPLLLEPADKTLRRWIAFETWKQVRSVSLSELAVGTAGDPLAQSLARSFLWAQALVFRRAQTLATPRKSGRPPKVRTEAPPAPARARRTEPQPAIPTPGQIDAARPRAEALAMLLEQLFERGRRDGPPQPAAPGRQVEFVFDPKRGELRIDWQNAWYSQWTNVCIEEGHEGESYCDCPRGGKGDCVHALWSWETIARALRHDLAGLSAELLDYLATPAWRRGLLSVDAALARLEPASAPSELLSWRLVSSTGRPVLHAQLHQPRMHGLSSGKRVDNPETVRRHDFPHRDEVLALVASQQSVPFPAGNLFRALELLAGFPRLFLDEDQSRPLAVRRGSFDLELSETGGRRARLRPRVDGDAGLGRKLVAAARQGPRRILTLSQPPTCVLVELTAAQQALLEAVGDGFELPVEGIEELAPRLCELERHAPLVLPAALEGEPVEADQQLRLRLAADESRALTVELLARPLPTGVHLVPGAGPASVGAFGGGKRLRAGRDLADEKARATALAAALGLPADGAEAGFRWQLSGDAALDLVARLRDREAEPVVEWLEQRRIEVLRRPGLEQLKLRVEQKHDWFGLAGELEVDGTMLPLEALLSAVRAGSRWIEVAPGRFAEIAGELRERIAGAAEVVWAGRAGLELSPAASDAVADLFDSAGELELCQAWRDSAERLRRARHFEPKLPEGLKAELRGYQVEGFRWLLRMAAWGVGVCLADDMGLGKTLEALAVLLERAARGPALVVAPTSVCFNWVRETQRFCPCLRPVLFREGDRVRNLTTLGPGDLLICSYGLLSRCAAMLAKHRFATAVFDEAQAMKNPATRRARAARDLDAEWKIALTGTPLENHLGELWSLMRVLAPGLLGSWEQFRERFAGPIERDRSPERRAALARVVRPFLLRRTKAEVARDLPARTELVREVSLSPAERKLYDQARLGALAELAGGSGGERPLAVLAAITRLRQLACHPRLFDPASQLPSSKLTELLGLVDELLEGGHRALIFSQFTSHLALVREALDARGIGYLYLDGHTPEPERARLVDRFQAGESGLFLISLKAGGTGLNLTAADYVLHLDPWWNPAVEDQATDRAHRIGQTRPVTVYRLVSKGTIEESILALHEEKRDLVAGVLEGTGTTARLSTEELLALLRNGGSEGDAEADDPGEEVVEPLAEQGEQDAPAEAARPAPGRPFESLARFAERFERRLYEQVSSGSANNYRYAAGHAFRWIESRAGRSLEQISVDELAGLLDAFARDSPHAAKPAVRAAVNRMRKLAGI